MTMTLVPDHRRTRGKLLLLAAFFVTLLHASSAAVKMVSESLVAADFLRRRLRERDVHLMPRNGSIGHENALYTTPIPSTIILIHH